MTVQATVAATLVDEWVRAGLTDAVIAPGSRSTPLALALVADDRVRVQVLLDERSAGFFALGLGLAAGRPAVVLTTSGTAAVELHPAVVEASHAGVPLLVCTADRPPELRDVGAPQTIDQDRLFGRAVRWYADPGVADAAGAGSWRPLAARAIAEANAGPVHLNLPFREPLLGEPDPLPPGRTDGGPWSVVARGERAIDLDALDLLAGSRRGIVVAGRGAGDPAAVQTLADAAGWPVLADPLSGCRAPGDAVVSTFDALLRDGRVAERGRPDAVLRLGAPPASKVLAAWLAGLVCPQVAVGGRDPAQRVSAFVDAAPEAVCWALAEALHPAPPAWAGWWTRAEAAAQVAIDAVLAEHPEPTEPGIARALVDVLPGDAVLVVSSSMPVRDVEWYGRPRHGLRVVSNRGANGIDGVVSTTLGVAAAEVGPTVGLLGDLAFLHDAGGLLGAARRGIDCTFFVIDNDGGGIFSFLPQADDLPGDVFERVFATPHGVDLAALAAVHGIATSEPAKADDVAPAITAAVDAGGVRMVLVRTDRAANVAVHDALNAAVAAAVDRLV